MKQRTLISNQFSGSCFEGQTKKAISVDIGSSLRDYSFGWHPKKKRGPTKCPRVKERAREKSSETRLQP